MVLLLGYEYTSLGYNGTLKLLEISPSQRLPKASFADTSPLHVNSSPIFTFIFIYLRIQYLPFFLVYIYKLVSLSQAQLCMRLFLGDYTHTHTHMTPTGHRKKSSRCVCLSICHTRTQSLCGIVVPCVLTRLRRTMKSFALKACIQMQ